MGGAAAQPSFGSLCAGPQAVLLFDLEGGPNDLRFPQPSRQSVEVGKKCAAVDRYSFKIEDDIRLVGRGDCPSYQAVDVQLVVGVGLARALEKIGPRVAVKGEDAGLRRDSRRRIDWIHDANARHVER